MLYLKNKTVQFNMRLSADEYEKLKANAKLNDMSVSNYIRSVLRSCSSIGGNYADDKTLFNDKL